jgi:hypothetical protein
MVFKTATTESADKLLNLNCSRTTFSATFTGNFPTARGRICPSHWFLRESLRTGTIRYLSLSRQQRK